MSVFLFVGSYQVAPNLLEKASRAFTDKECSEVDFRGSYIVGRPQSFESEVKNPGCLYSDTGVADISDVVHTDLEFTFIAVMRNQAERYVFQFSRASDDPDRWVGNYSVVDGEPLGLAYCYVKRLRSDPYQL